MQNIINQNPSESGPDGLNRQLMWRKIGSKFMVKYYLCVMCVFLVFPGYSHAKDVHESLFIEISKPDIPAYYDVDKKKIVVNSGKFSKKIRDFLSHNISQSTMEADKTISEYCKDEGTYDLSYDISHITENFVSIRKITSYMFCFAGAEAVIEHLNIFNYKDALLQVDINPSIQTELKYDWNNVDSECNYIERDVVYSLVVDKNGELKVNLKKNQICELEVKIEKKEKNIILKDERIEQN